MHYIQKSIKDWMVKSLQESILLYDFRDFIEAFDSFAIQSQSDYNIIYLSVQILISFAILVHPCIMLNL